ncbi:MAG: DUF6455 family protein [Paracoccaceae bacterium]|nr:DUF6455 family protein [Paracoccaceae bacterium]MDG1737987.1 DUF6455 family protein [Paracoccaceae bacterium]MDG2259636.1 DUF6455 family protein [Paracoccaceae bacterium]
MADDSRFTRHARLVSEMADRIGLDLVEEMQRANVDNEDVRMMVHRCEGCTDPEACEKVLAQGRPLENPPEYCRNANEFSRLKP